MKIGDYIGKYPFTTDLEDFVLDVTKVMQYWLDCHTDRETWAEVWLLGEDASWAAKEYRGKINNQYFEFDWRRAALKIWCERNTTGFYVCGNYRSINENGMYCENEDECADADDEVVTAEELMEFMEDIYYGDEIYFLLSDSDWVNALVNEGFDVYRKAFERYTCVIEEEVSDVLLALERASDGNELAAALTWALHVAHVHGEIIKDYEGETPGIVTSDLYSKLCDVQQYGLSEVFDQSEIDQLFGTTDEADA